MTRKHDPRPRHYEAGEYSRLVPAERLRRTAADRTPPESQTRAKPAGHMVGVMHTGRIRERDHTCARYLACLDVAAKMGAAWCPAPCDHYERRDERATDFASSGRSHLARWP